MPELILASTSPYRRALLARLALPFTWEDPRVDEDEYKLSVSSPREIAERLAHEKAKSVQTRNPGAFVIGADQLVALEGRVLGKPGSEEAAVEQLKLLVGKTHELITAVALLTPSSSGFHTDITRLQMENLSETSLQRYVAFDKPIDCAGSYKIESLGISLFRKIEAEDVTAIQGLPLMALARLLRNARYTIP